MGGWTKTKLMLFSTQVEVVVELKLELSLAIDYNGYARCHMRQCCARFVTLTRIITRMLTIHPCLQMEMNWRLEKEASH